MASTEETDELLYHLRELRADLSTIRADLETATSVDIDRSVVLAWTGAAALLEHDLEVHFPRALALLGAAPPDVAPHTADPAPGQRSPGAESLAAIAGDARRRIEAALAALPPDHEPPPSTAGLLEAARISTAVHQLIAGRSEQALAEEILQQLRALRADLESILASLETASRIDPLALPEWAKAKALLERALAERFPRMFQILGEDPPESEPRPGLAPSGRIALDATSFDSAAKEVCRRVAAALALLPIDIGPSSPTTGLREATRAGTAAHQIVAKIHELLTRPAEPS